VALLAAALGSGTASAQAPAFPAPVEAWRTLIDQEAAGSDIPIEFLLSWVQVESYGNPCSLGIPNVEAGIAQTYHPDDDRYGATFDQLRAACVEGTQKQARPLTDDEKALQVASLVNLVKGSRRSVRSSLASAGVTWSETSPDFWSLVKLFHALPAYTSAGYLAACRDDLGQAPQTWAEYRGWIESLSAERVVAINSAVRPWSSVSERRRLFANAEKTGGVVVAQPSPAPSAAPANP
jgi:hypothetical protein